MDAALIGPTTLSLTQAFASFTTFLPPITEIRKNDPANNPEFAADVRLGEVAAVGVTVGVGLIVSSISGNSAPTVVAVVAAFALVFLYESTLRSVRPLESEAK